MGPIQDPSALTTAQIMRENFWLREVIEVRLNGMDKALQLLQTFADRTPTTMDVQHEVTALREVVMEMFRGSQKEVGSAFAAAKEAIAKSEAGVTKQIDGILELGRTNTKTIDDKFSDIKDRITIIESKAAGASSLWGYIVGGIGMLIGLGPLVAIIIRALR